MSKPFHLMAMSLLASACLAVPVAAQPSGEESKGWGFQAPESEAPKTWYAMISVEQAIGRGGCDTYHYKVSTRLPIVLKGPPEVRTAHADELTAWWMLHVQANAPLAYRWLTTSEGHEPPKVYFRESASEVFEAFRSDGNFRKARGCEGAMLVTLDPENFHFPVPHGFTTVDFGNEPAPQNVTVAKNLSNIPGSP